MRMLSTLRLQILSTTTLGVVGIVLECVQQDLATRISYGKVLATTRKVDRRDLMEGCSDAGPIGKDFSRRQVHLGRRQRY